MKASIKKSGVAETFSELEKEPSNFIQDNDMLKEEKKRKKSQSEMEILKADVESKEIKEAAMKCIEKTPLVKKVKKQENRFEENLANYINVQTKIVEQKALEKELELEEKRLKIEWLKRKNGRKEKEGEIADKYAKNSD